MLVYDSVEISDVTLSRDISIKLLIQHCYHAIMHMKLE